MSSEDAAEKENVQIGEILREELAWAEKIYEENTMDPWVNGFRTALRTVLREANKKASEEVKE